MAWQFKNDSHSTLNGSIDNSQTTLVVTSAAPFSTSNDFVIKIGSEYMLVTGVSGTTYTVTRGYEGSTAASHADLAAVQQMVTAAIMSDINTRVGQAFIGARVYRSTTQTITTSEAAFTLDAERFDTDNFHSTSTNTSRFTIPTGLGGKYIIGGALRTTTGSPPAGSYITIIKNGTTYLAVNTVQAFTTIHTLVELVSGDYIELAAAAGSSTVTFGTSDATTSEHAIDFWIGKLDSGKIGTSIGASVNNSSNIALTNGSITYLTFDSESFDTDGFHSTSSNTGRLTIPTGLGGRYIVVGQVEATGSTSTSQFSVIRKNGSTYVGLGQGDGGDTGATIFTMTTLLDLVPTDYLELGVRITGTSKTAIAGDILNPTFSLLRVDSGTGNYTGSKWGSGTAFPTGPATNDKYSRTDRGLDYYYDGTRWLTVAQYIATIPMSATAGISAAMTFYYPIDDTYTTYIEKINAIFYSSGLTSGAYWTLTLGKETAPEVTTTLGSCNIQSGTNANWLPRVITVGAAVDPATYSNLNFSLGKTGSPGATYCSVFMTYRLVG